MSDGMNRVTLLGNLGADPDLRYTPTGVAVLSMRLATSESWRDKNKELQERTEWHSVVVFGNRAEGLARVLRKGSGVLVEGGLRTSSYEKDGQVRSRTEVHAREVIFTGRRLPPPAREVLHDGGYAPMPPPQVLDDGGYAPKPPPEAPVEGGAATRPLEGEVPGLAKGRAGGFGVTKRADPIDELPF